MIKYTVRTIAGYFKLECDLRDFEAALRIVRKRSEDAKEGNGIDKEWQERAEKLRGEIERNAANCSIKSEG